MIENIIQDYLLSRLNVQVYTELPSDPGDSFVSIERTGGTERNHIRTAMVAVQSYGSSMYNAAVLHDEVMAALEDMAELPSVGSCRLNSEYNFTDTQTKRYRYQAVYDIVYYND